MGEQRRYGSGVMVQRQSSDVRYSPVAKQVAFFGATGDMPRGYKQSLNVVGTTPEDVAWYKATQPIRQEQIQSTMQGLTDIAMSKIYPSGVPTRVGAYPPKGTTPGSSGYPVSYRMSSGEVGFFGTGKGQGMSIPKIIPKTTPILMIDDRGLKSKPSMPMPRPVLIPRYTGTTSQGSFNVPQGAKVNPAFFPQIKPKPQQSIIKKI